MKRTDLGQLTETNCLTIAADLEGAIIEKKFFEAFSSLGTKFAKVERATKIHKQRIELALTTERWSKRAA